MTGRDAVEPISGSIHEEIWDVFIALTVLRSACSEGSEYVNASRMMSSK